MTLTATRATGTVRPTSSPTLRFLGGVGMMVLQFFGGLVSVPLATILGALVIGLGGLYDEGLGLGAYAGLILALLGWGGSRSGAVPGWFSLAGSPPQPCSGSLTINSLNGL